MLLDDSASSWINLLAWLRDLFEYSGVGIAALKADDLPKIHYAASDAFQVANEMRGKVGWKNLEPLLQIHKRSMERQAGGEWKWT